MPNRPYRSHVTTDHVGNTQAATLAAFPSLPRVATSGPSYMGLFRPYTYNGVRKGEK